MKMTKIALIAMSLALYAAAGDKPKKQPPESSLDQMLKQLAATQGAEQKAQPGSLWTPTAQFSDLSADLRARRTGDIVTIQVNESASAVSSGTVKTARNSSVQANTVSRTALHGFRTAMSSRPSSRSAQNMLRQAGWSNWMSAGESSVHRRQRRPR